MNLAMDGKQGTNTAGWFKPDVIAVGANVSSLLSNDASVYTSGRLAYYCQNPTSTEPVPDPYRAGTGTSFAAPVVLGAAALASRHYANTAGAASPALVKAMLIAGTRSMRGGVNRARFTMWTANQPLGLGRRVIPTAAKANGHYYEVVGGGPHGKGGTTGLSEPNWPTHGTRIPDGDVIWEDKGLEAVMAAIGSFPNDQQGFGQVNLKDVLSDYPARVYVDDQELSVGGSWTQSYAVHDGSLPVRIALVWTDPPNIWSGGSRTIAGSPLVNNLNLEVAPPNQSGSCPNRYLGNSLDASDVSVTHACAGGTADALNNVEVARFFSSAGATFTIKVTFPNGKESQRFSVVVWNAYSGTPPPPAPSNFVAKGTSETSIGLTWVAAGNAQYEIERSSGPRDPYTHVATVPVGGAASYTDGGRDESTTYLYRVRARIPNTRLFSDWVVDPGTTIMVSGDIEAGLTTVQAVHITQLRDAIAAARRAAELDPFSWGETILDQQRTLIRASHLTELRTALNAARAVLGLQPISFAAPDDPEITEAVTVKAVHIQKLRDGVQ